MLLLQCPHCKNRMKYQSIKGNIAKSRKACVYCGKSFLVKQHIVPAWPLVQLCSSFSLMHSSKLHLNALTTFSLPLAYEGERKCGTRTLAQKSGTGNNQDITCHKKSQKRERLKTTLNAFITAISASWNHNIYKASIVPLPHSEDYSHGKTRRYRTG